MNGQNRNLLPMAGLVAALLVVASGLSAQTPRPSPIQVPAATANVERELARARRAQRDFERTRRQHYVRAPFTSEQCHEHIGRFCLNHDADEGWEPVPEDARVTEARARLIATLDTVATVAGADEWLFGQRIKYRFEAGRGDETRGLIESCAGSDFWCAALDAFVLQQRGAYSAAERAFDRVLGHLDVETRCAWTDLTRLLDRGARGRYDRLGCEGSPRRAFHRSFWHLSDPMWLSPGRERRSEHLSRHVRALLEADAASGYGLPWDDDVEELTIRYGWPAGWDVAWRRIPGVRTERAIQAHRPPEAQFYVVEGLFDADRSVEPAWTLENDRPRASWSAAYGPVHALPHQVAGFRRDDQRVVAAVFAAPPELESCVVESGLFLANAFQVLESVQGQGTLPLRAPEPDPSGSATIVGVETRCRDGVGAARARSGLPATPMAMSDLLILEPSETLPTHLDEALLKARRGSTAKANETVGVYWEWYAPPGARGPLAITLSLTAEEKSLLRKALEWSGLAGRDEDEVGIRWREPGGAPVGRSVEVQLPDLSPGTYRLTLHVESEGVGAVATTRGIVIEP